MICEKCGRTISRYENCPCGATRQNQHWGVIQIDTTGLKPEEGAEILRVSLISRHCSVTWNRTYRPMMMRAWPEAEKINGISPEKVQNCKPLRGDEVQFLSEELKKYTLLVTNQGSFVRKFLDAAGVTYPEIYGITGLFEDYIEEHGLASRSTSLNNCATYFGFTEDDMPEIMKPMEKAYKVWFCYQNLAVLQKEEIVSVMGQDLEAHGVPYKSFINESQTLDYLKSIQIAKISQNSIPRLYYTGRFMPEATIDVYPMGLSFKEDGSVDRIVLAVRDRIIAIREEVFVRMQKFEWDKEKKKKEDSLFNMDQTSILDYVKES